LFWADIGADIFSPSPDSTTMSSIEARAKSSPTRNENVNDWP
jgi:hypothetical protein